MLSALFEAKVTVAEKSSPSKSKGIIFSYSELKTAEFLLEEGFVICFSHHFQE
jgi:hypothetical protein